MMEFKSIGMMTFPIQKNHPFMFQTANQSAKNTSFSHFCLLKSPSKSPLDWTDPHASHASFTGAARVTRGTWSFRSRKMVVPMEISMVDFHGDLMALSILRCDRKPTAFSMNSKSKNVFVELTISSGEKIVQPWT